MEPKSSERCCDQGEESYTTIILGTYEMINDNKGLWVNIVNSKETLRQEPSETMSVYSWMLDDHIYVDDLSQHSCEVSLVFDNNLHEISKSYAYDIIVRASVSDKKGRTHHVSLFSDRVKRDTNSVYTNTIFTINYKRFSLNSICSGHVCCLIRRVCLETPVATPELDIGKQLLHQQILTDACLKVGDSEFKAHRAILALRSNVFRNMFSDPETSESRTGEVTIDDDIEAPTVEAMLSYMYTGHTNGYMTKFAVKLFKAAHKYEIADLVDKCQEALMIVIRVENIVVLLDLASSYKLEELKRKILKNFVTKNEERVIQWTGFPEFLCRDLSIDSLVYTLKLCAKSKAPQMSYVKEKAFEWAKEHRKDLPKNKEYFGLLESHFELMTELFAYMNRRNS